MGGKGGVVKRRGSSVRVLAAPRSKEMAELRLLFIGSGAVNFGGAEGPWDHSKRLEQLGGVKVVAIADPDLPKAEQVLKRKLSEPRADLYRDCKVYSDYRDALAAAKPDIAFIGITLC